MRLSARIRCLPAVIVLVLLSLAATGPPRAVGPAPPPQLQPHCDDFASAVTGDSTVAVPTGTGIEQALPAGMSVAACSLRTKAPYLSAPVIVVRNWDPTTLAPDPDAIALRRVFFDPSTVLFTNNMVPRATFVPPVLTRSVPDVAEPPGPQVVMQLLHAVDFGFLQAFVSFFTPDGSADLPAARRFDDQGNRDTLTGPHPVLAHAVCAGDTDLAALRIAQCVTRTDVKPFPAPKEFLQKFRVPQQVELRWVELALGEVFVPYFEQAGEGHVSGTPGFPVLAVIDGDDLPQPARDMPEALVEAPFSVWGLFSSALTWVSHLDFDRTVTLEPGHDYWIYVRDAGATTFLNRRIHGNESAAFQAGVGPYFARADSGGDWVQAADQVLAFRIIGRPTAPPAPPPGPAPPPAAFALSATPNPARSAARVKWSGAVGPVRVQVLDAHGRRVAEGAGGAAGSWTWAGMDQDGRAVASGIYFIRARDSAGQLSTQRVMIVR